MASTAGWRARPAGWTPAPAVLAVCSGCGAPGADRASVADLEVSWLVGDGRGGIEPARFCQSCRPRGAVGELACAACGDGPLLAAELAAAGDRDTAALIEAWLVETGWRPAGPWCPACARTVHPRGARPDSSGTPGWGSGA